MRLLGFCDCGGVVGPERHDGVPEGVAEAIDVGASVSGI